MKTIYAMYMYFQYIHHHSIGMREYFFFYLFNYIGLYTKIILQQLILFFFLISFVVFSSKVWSLKSEAADGEAYRRVWVWSGGRWSVPTTDDDWWLRKMTRLWWLVELSFVCLVVQLVIRSTFYVRQTNSIDLCSSTFEVLYTLYSTVVFLEALERFGSNGRWWLSFFLSSSWV